MSVDEKTEMKRRTANCFLLNGLTGAFLWLACACGLLA